MGKKYLSRMASLIVESDSANNEIVIIEFKLGVIYALN